MRVLAILIVLFAPPALYYSTRAASLDARTRAKEAELAALEVRVECAVAAERKISEFHAEQTRIGDEVRKLRTILPPEIDVADLEDLTETAASSSGVLLTDFEPEDPEDEEVLEKITVRAEVNGTLSGTSTFLQNLENSRIIIDVGDVTLNRDQDQWRTTFTMTTHAFPDPYVMPPPEGVVIASGHRAGRAGVSARS